MIFQVIFGVMNNKKVLIIGAGYAGLSCALELVRNNVPIVIVEKSQFIGGLSQTISVNNTKFELGPHIYFEKDPSVISFWNSISGVQLKSYRRNNRIYYNGKYIKSPLSLINALIKIGPFKISKLLFSFLIGKIKKKEIHSAEDWVIANFGKELYNTFFKVYNEKIWGLDCSKISPNWAGQRIKSSLSTMIYKSLKKDKDFIVKTFLFPDGGSQTIFNGIVNELQTKSTPILKGITVEKISPLQEEFEVTFNNGEKGIFSHVVSTIHLAELRNLFADYSELQHPCLNPHFQSLRYRNLILVNLVFNKNETTHFNEHWIDIHDPSITALRITNFSNYNFGLSETEMVGVGWEYNCFDNDLLWAESEEKIIQLALEDLKKMNLCQSQPIDALVVKIPNAYPVYFKGYEDHTEKIFSAFKKITGLQLIGRNSMYKWNNMHHSVKTGLLAAKNILGENHDVFSVKGNVSIGKDSD